MRVGKGGWGAITLGHLALGVITGPDHYEHGLHVRFTPFTAADLRADRDLGIEDTSAVLVVLPQAYVRRPWNAHGYNRGDEVRLTLRDVATCQGGPGPGSAGGVHPVVGRH